MAEDVRYAPRAMPVSRAPLAAEAGTGLACLANMRRALRHAPLVFAIAIAGCGGSPDVHALAQSAHSWAATADFTADRLAHGAISRRFAVVTFDRVSTELQQLAQSAAQVRDTSAASARDRAELTAQLSVARHAVVALDSAAARDNRAQLAAPQRRVGASEAALDSLASATEKP